MNITDLYKGINELQNGYQLSKGTEGRYAYKFPTVLSIGRIIISDSCSMHKGLHELTPTEMHTAGPQVPEPSS